MFAEMDQQYHIAPWIWFEILIIISSVVIFVSKVKLNDRAQEALTEVYIRSDE